MITLDIYLSYALDIIIINIYFLLKQLLNSCRVAEKTRLEKFGNSNFNKSWISLRYTNYLKINQSMLKKSYLKWNIIFFFHNHFFNTENIHYPMEKKTLFWNLFFNYVKCLVTIGEIVLPPKHIQTEICEKGFLIYVFFTQNIVQDHTLHKAQRSH